MMRINNKTATRARFGDRSIYMEIVDYPAVDDVIAFLAHSEAFRKVHERFGNALKVQTPSDTLKEELLSQLE